MTIEYLKQAHPPVKAIDTETTETVSHILAKIETGGEEAVRDYARELDGWHGEIVVGEADFVKA